MTKVVDRTEEIHRVDVHRVDARKRVRFPFTGFPKGWFAVALSGDVHTGEIARLHYFGRDIVAYRGESGRAFVTDAYCPHLGAHLGHGGKVEGDTIRCPFHGWRFEGEGRCVEVPYADKIPPKARLETYPAREMNGVIFAFFDPAGGAPWDLPEFDEEGWTPAKCVLWPGLRTHVQEIFENTVDTAHIGPVHDGRGARLGNKPIMNGEYLRLDVEFDAPGTIVGMPELMNDVLLEVTLRGLGWVAVHTHVRNVDVHARQRIFVTPVDETTVDIRGLVQVKRTDDAAYTEELARLFFDAYVEDFAKDFPIRENKRYLERPLLAKGDGPIPVYRKWCTQFYDTPDAQSSERAADVVPDVPVSALGARRPGGSFAGLLGPVQRRVTETAQTLLAAARARFGASDAAVHDPFDDRLDDRLDDPPPAGSSSEARSDTPAAPKSGLTGPTTLRVESAEDYFATLEKRFVPAAAAGVDAVFQWELGGTGGSVFHARVRDGRIEIQRGAHDRPTVALVMDANDYVRVVNGELDGIRAFTTGSGKVKGSIAAAMKMRSLFPQ